MPRPILWALGIAGCTALSSLQIGDRLKAAGLLGGPRPAQAAQAAAPARAAGAPESGRVLTLAADHQGHFSTFAIMDGVSVKVLVDTGATSVALPLSEARRIGLRLSERDFRRPVQTANGTVSAAPARIAEIRLGSIVIRNVEAVVLPDRALGTTLLGMSFLSRLDDFGMSRGRLNLKG